MIEADPVDAVAAATGIAVAQLDPPLGRPRLRNEAERPVHGGALLRHAAWLPLAVHTDVECDSIVQDRRPRRICRQGYCREHGRRQNPLHRGPNDTALVKCRNLNPRRRQRKRKAAEPKRRRLFNHKRLLAEVVRNVIEGAVQLVADALHGGNSGNGDQSGDQAVLNRGRTLGIFDQLQKLGHLRSPNNFNATGSCSREGVQTAGISVTAV